MDSIVMTALEDIQEHFPDVTYEGGKIIIEELTLLNKLHKTCGECEVTYPIELNIVYDLEGHECAICGDR